MGFKHKRQEKEKRKKDGARAACKAPQGNFAKQKKGMSSSFFWELAQLTEYSENSAKRKCCGSERMFGRGQKKKGPFRPFLLLNWYQD